MKLSTVSTLWDYINRAMPWNAPKSLTADEVYAVTAYMLNLGDIVPATTSCCPTATSPQVQQRLPNRNGMTTAHGLWPGSRVGRRAPDVQGTRLHAQLRGRAEASLRRCPTTRAMRTAIWPSRTARSVPQRGVDTVRAGADGLARSAAAPAKPAGADAAPAGRWRGKHSCTACHGLDGKLVGPSFARSAARYGARSDAATYLQRQDPQRRRRHLGRRADAAASPAAGRCPGARAVDRARCKAMNVWHSARRAP